MDVERSSPAQDANEVACREVKVLLDRLGEVESVPLFVFDAGYDPVKLQQGLLMGAPARSSSVFGQDVACRLILTSPVRPRPPGGRFATGRR